MSAQRKAALLAEASRRGLLSPRKEQLYQEAVKRGLFPEQKQQVANRAPPAERGQPAEQEQPAESVLDIANVSQQNPLAQGLSGINEGIASSIGMIPDAIGSAINSGLSLLGVESRVPSYTDYLKGLGQDAGMIGTEAAQGPGGRIARKVGDFMGGSLLPGAGMALKTANIAPNIARDVGVGAAAGLGAGLAGELSDEPSVVNELIGAVAGGVSVAALPALSAGLLRSAIRRPGEAAQMRENIASFDTAGIKPSLGQASESRVIEGAETIAGNVPAGQGVMRRFVQDNAQKMQANIEDLGQKISGRGGVDDELAGRGVQRGAMQFVNEFKEKSSDLYGRLYEKIPEETITTAKNTQKILDDFAGETSGVLQTLKSNKLTAMKKDVDLAVDKAGGIPFRELQRLRTIIGEDMQSATTMVDTGRGQLKRLYGAISEDIKDVATMRGASAEFNRANNYYKGGRKRIDDILDPQIRKIEPEKVFKSLQSGSESTLRTVLKSLKNEQKNNLAAAVLTRLGRANPGVQDATGEAFSVASFLTNFNKLSPKKRDVLFNSTPQLMQYNRDIKRIAKTSELIKNSTQVLANPSGTANRAATYVGLGAVGASGGTLLPAVAAAMAGSGVAAKLMTNQKFIRWVAKSTEIKPDRLPAHISTLVQQIQESDDPDYQDSATAFLSSLSKTPL